MAYDIAAKVLIEKCRGEILRRFLGIQVTESTLLEDVPQETTSLRRSDFPLLVTEKGGRQRLVLMEIQSRWERNFPLRLLEYRCRHKLKHEVEVLSCVLLLRPSATATDRYADTEVDYRYRLVRVYEVDAAEVVAEPAVCLLPLVPLMRRGVELTEVADRLPGELIARRRDLMIESVTYELIKQVTRPLAALERWAEDVTAGRNPQPFTPDCPRETQTLATAFNHMVEQLQENQGTLHEYAVAIMRNREEGYKHHSSFFIHQNTR